MPTDVKVYPGEEFEVLEENSKVLVSVWANKKDEHAEGYEAITIENPRP